MMGFARALRRGVWAAAVLAIGGSTAWAQPAREHAQLIAGLGGVYVGPQTAYVSRVGERMAAAAGMPPGRCVFTVVNSQIVNAFTAPPGCYVYVTRGLLAIVNSEAELAAVLGHELGHVAANHAGRQRNQEALTGLAAVLVGAATGSDLAGSVAGRVAKLGSLSYSRGQEYEADRLALGYLPAAGYAAEGLSRMLDDLRREDAFSARLSGRGEGGTPVWARTHPLTSDRIARASAEAARAPASDMLTLRQDEYLSAVQGLPYDDDAAQGLVRGGSYLHPALRIAFDAPPGFALRNQPESVQITGQGGMAEFAGGRATSTQLEAYADAVMRGVLRGSAGEAGAPQRTRINGVEAVVLPARATSRGRPVDVTVVAYALGGDEAYHFITVAPAGQGQVFDRMFDSFRRLSEREADGLSGRRIAVVDVKPGDTTESLAARMAQDPDRMGRFLMLNAMDPGQPPPPGGRVKLLVEGRR